MMAISDHIEWLIWAHGRTNAEEANLSREYGVDRETGIELFSPNVQEWLLAERPEVKKIEAYLSGLETETLLKIEALLYLGRDGGDFAEVLAELESNPSSREDIIRNIVEKWGAYLSYFGQAASMLGSQIDEL